MATGAFGNYVRRQRLVLLVQDPAYSLRRVARAIKIEPSFLSKVERGVAPPPSEAKIKALAVCLREDPDVLLALAGKVSSDLQTAIRRRPRLFAALIRELRAAPDDGVAGIVREARAKYGAEKS
jgi:transcriptional regulator with XRE-family HTH domain